MAWYPFLSTARLSCFSQHLRASPLTPPFFISVPSVWLSRLTLSCLATGQLASLLTSESNTYSQCTERLFHGTWGQLEALSLCTQPAMRMISSSCCQAFRPLGFLFLLFKHSLLFSLPVRRKLGMNSMHSPIPLFLNQMSSNCPLQTELDPTVRFRCSDSQCHFQAPYPHPIRDI